MRQRQRRKGSIVKKLLVFALVGAMAACVALAGCAGNSTSASSASSGSSSSTTSSAASESAPAASSASESAATASSASSASADSSAAPVAGGWTIPESTKSSDLTDEEKETFEKAAGAQAGKNFEPIAILATQVVSGQNYAYLCRGTSTTQNPTTEWDVVVVYKNLQGDASVTKVTPIDLTDIKTTEEVIGAEATGAWEVREATNGVAMTAEAAQAFSKASEGYEGIQINPLALLGTQVVSGTNYMILGTGKPVVDSPKCALYVVTAYENLEGNSEFTNTAMLDLLAYV